MDSFKQIVVPWKLSKYIYEPSLVCERGTKDEAMGMQSERVDWIIYFNEFYVCVESRLSWTKLPAIGMFYWQEAITASPCKETKLVGTSHMLKRSI